MSKHHDPATELYLEVEARQRNTVWPDAMLNSRSVDELVFKGSPKATKIQRAGVFVVGASYTLVGLLFVLMGIEQDSVTLVAFAAIALTVGVWVIRNAFLRLEPKPRDRHPHRIPPSIQ